MDRQVDFDSGCLGATVVSREHINQMSAQSRGAGGVTRPFGLYTHRFDSPKWFAWISHSEIQPTNTHGVPSECQAVGHKDDNKFTRFLVNRPARVSVLHEGDGGLKGATRHTGRGPGMGQIRIWIVHLSCK